MFMNICHKYPPSLLFWKSIRLINSSSPMCRSVTMDGNRRDVDIDIGIKVLPTLTMIDSPSYNMPQMGNDTSCDKYPPLCVIINSPRIAKSVRYHFKAIFHRMITPNATVDINSFSFQQIFGKRIIVIIKFPISFGLADFGRGSKAL